MVMLEALTRELLRLARIKAAAVRKGDIAAALIVAGRMDTLVTRIVEAAS